MKTLKFLAKYLADEAMVTIADTKGSILYEGVLGDMPVRVVRNTTLSKIDGLGSLNDIIIEVEVAR